MWSIILLFLYCCFSQKTDEKEKLIKGNKEHEENDPWEEAKDKGLEEDFPDSPQ